MRSEALSQTRGRAKAVARLDGGRFGPAVRKASEPPPPITRKKSATASNLATVPGDRYEVHQSRSVRSVWVWRAFLLMSLVALGIAILLAGNGATSFAILWGVIAAGWFGIAMWLWRMHSNMEEQEFRRLKGGGPGKK